MTASYVPPGAGTHYPMTDGDHLAKAIIQDTHGEFEVFEVHAPAGPASPPHASPWTAVLYLLSGRVSVQVDGMTYDVEPGGLVTMPAGAPCTFEVVGDAARFLAITSGPGAGRFFADFASSVPRDRPVEESMGAIVSVTTRHGVTLGQLRTAPGVPDRVAGGGS